MLMFRKAVVLALVVSGMVALTGCPPTVFSPVVGQWTLAYSIDTYDFRADGTYYVETNGVSAGPFAWSWNNDASLLTMELPGGWGTMPFTATFEEDTMTLALDETVLMVFTKI